MTFTLTVRELTWDDSQGGSRRKRKKVPGGKTRNERTRKEYDNRRDLSALKRASTAARDTLETFCAQPVARRAPSGGNRELARKKVGEEGRDWGAMIVGGP